MFAFFYNVFLQNTVNYTFVAIKRFQNIIFLQCFQFPHFPKSLKTPLFTLFNFSMFQCRWPTPTHIQKILRKHCFFTMFSVENTVIYFFGIKSVQNTGFCSVFNAVASKSPSIPLSPQTFENTAIYIVFFNFSMLTYIHKILQKKHCFLQCFCNVFRQKHRNLLFQYRSKTLVVAVFSMLWHPKFKISLFTVFFSFLSVLPLPEAYENDPKFRFNTLLSSDTQTSSTWFWSRCETVNGPPLAKADIATAKLTNVIEHLV